MFNHTREIHIIDGCIFRRRYVAADFNVNHLKNRRPWGQSGYPLHTSWKERNSILQNFSHFTRREEWKMSKTEWVQLSQSLASQMPTSHRTVSLAISVSPFLGRCQHSYKLCHPPCARFPAMPVSHTILIYSHQLLVVRWSEEKLFTPPQYSCCILRC